MSMKLPKRFTRAMSALKNAFLNGTLAKGSCKACAVGNIVAAGYGAKVEKRGPYFSCTVDNYYWGNVFSTPLLEEPFIDMSYYNGSAKNNIEVTGYSVKELAQIEQAFESNTRIESQCYSDHDQLSIIDDQWNGLEAVIKVMCKIEGIKAVDYWLSYFEYNAPKQFVSV